MFAKPSVPVLFLKNGQVLFGFFIPSKINQLIRPQQSISLSIPNAVLRLIHLP